MLLSFSLFAFIYYNLRLEEILPVKELTVLLQCWSAVLQPAAAPSPW